MSDDRLPRLNSLCDFIDRIVTGEAATQMIDAGTTATAGVLAVLPNWVWLEPLIDVGRKSRGRNGATLLMPVRLVWNESPILILEPGETRVLEWRLSGLGHRATGQATITQSGFADVQITGVQDLTVEAAVYSFNRAKAFTRHVTNLVAAGTDARWGLLSSLESFTLSNLEQANRRVAAELGSSRQIPMAQVVDQISLDALLSQMLFGVAGSSVISRMLDRCLHPDTFDRVDPMRYLSVAIRARSEEAIRGAIGDPKVGPKVRRIFEASGATTIDELLDAYNTAYPKDSLARKRAIAAITANSDLAVTQHTFNDEILIGGAE